MKLTGDEYNRILDSICIHLHNSFAQNDYRKLVALERDASLENAKLVGLIKKPALEEVLEMLGNGEDEKISPELYEQACKEYKELKRK